MKKIIYKIARLIIKLIVTFVKFGKVKIEPEEAEKEISKVYKPKELFNEKEIQNLPVDENIDLSIIVPVYNSEKFLRKCMGSIVNQKTKYKFEVIAINDGSTDTSLEILREYEKKYGFVKVITQENGGISRARNTGLNNAKGKYVGFIDNDDYIAENYVEKLLDRAYDKNAEFVKCNHVKFSGETGEIIKSISNKEISISGYIDDKILEYKGYIWGRNPKKKFVE